jgi:hypothetical protein
MQITDTTNKEVAKFNMGLATLETIRKLLDFYHKISIMDSLSLDDKNFKVTDTLECQIIKSRTCNQVFIASRPLLDDNQKEQLKKELTGTQIKVRYIIGSNGKAIPFKRVFSYDVETNCDKFISKLTDELQANKVFMPGKGEAHLF